MPCSRVDPIFVRLTRLVILAGYIVTEKCAGIFNIIESEDFRVKECLVLHQALSWTLSWGPSPYAVNIWRRKVGWGFFEKKANDGVCSLSIYQQKNTEKKTKKQKYDWDSLRKSKWWRGMNRGSVPYPCGSFGKFINSLMESGGEGADGNVRANELEGGWQRVQINVFFQIVQIYLSDFSKFGKGFGRFR